MDVSLVDIQQQMLAALALRGISSRTAELIVSDHLDAELEGRPTHGIGKFLLLDDALAERRGGPTVAEDRDAFVLVDGNRELGHAAAVFCAELAVDRAARSGAGIVALRNASRFSRLGPYAERIADQGFLALVTNNAGPPAVAPFGSSAPLLGTNPICFGFPGAEDPTIVDFATSKRVWGEIRQAVLEQRALPPGAFLDANGAETRDPDEADAVLPFGGAKGSALCLSIELLIGGISGALMGSQVQTEYDLGALFVALPSVEGFRVAAEQLLDEIRASRPRVAGEPVSVPGEGSRMRRERARASGRIQVDPTVLEHLQQMSEGVSGGLSGNAKLN